MRTLKHPFRTISTIWLILTLLSPSLSFAAYSSISVSQTLTLEETVAAATHQQIDHTAETRIFVSRIKQVDAWVFGTSALIPNDPEAHPQILLFLAEYKRDSWLVYLEHSQQFEQALHLIPPELLTAEQRATLESSSSIAPQGNGSMQLSLPWATGESQYFTGGPHGLTVRDAIDFSGGTGIVRSAREGVAYTPCGASSDYVRVDHGGGLSTNYYHLTSISVSNGQSIGRGTAIGRQSTSASCLGGSATGNHVHFWISQNGTSIAINGIDIGGWTVIAGAANYQGCLRRVRDNHQICATGLIPNEGMIGSGVNQLPNTPTPLAPAHNTYFSSNSVTLSWQDAGDPDNGPRNSRDYYLDVLNSSGGIVYSSGWTFDTSRTVTLAQGSYTWRVKAGDGANESAWTSARSFTINRPPNAPTLINPGNGATVNGSSVTLSWQDAGDPDNGPRNSRDYYLEVMSSSGGIIYTSGWTFDTSRTITLSAGSYTWRVKTGDGLGESIWSSRSFNVVTVPEAPTYLQQSGWNEFSLTISWYDMSSNEDGFKIYKWLPVDGEWQFVEYGTVEADTSSFTDHWLTCDTSYYYQVSAYNSYGESPRTDWIEANTTACTYPAPPGDPYVIGTSPSSITIGWEDRNTIEDGFIIYRWDWDWINEIWAFFEYDRVDKDVTTYTNTGLNCDTQYFYLLTAYKDNWESSTTGWVRGITDPCPTEQATQTPYANTAIPLTASATTTHGIPPTSTIKPSATATATRTASPSQALTNTTVSTSVTAQPTKQTANPTVTTQLTQQPTKPPEPTLYQVFQPHVYKAQEEWILHRTEDGQHPDENEQQLLWLMNRARSNPAQEGVWLTTEPDSSIALARYFFQVDTDLLQKEFQSYAPKPPAAFDRRLYLAARAHSEDLIRRDAQDHNNQFERVSALGFACDSGRGNVFSFAESALQGHAAFNIDWGGDDGTGMQTGRGHRMGIMSVDGDYTNAGFAMVPENNINTQVGPFVTTQNICHANTEEPNHFNRFIVGTVWRDLNNNGRYDPGEGLSDIEVRPSRGKYYAVTSKGGGYAIPVEFTGEVTIRFSLSTPHFKTVTINADSVLVDLKLTAHSALIVSNTPTATPNNPVDIKEVTGRLFP